MKIAINCIFYQPKGGGIREYIHNLVWQLHEIDHENTYIFYVLKDQYEYASKNFPSNSNIKIVPFYSSGLIKIIIRGIFEKIFWKKEEKIEKFDIFHSPFFHSPKFKHAKTILTVHDLRLYRYPSTYTLLRYLFLKYSVRKSIKEASHIIAISDFTKREILDVHHKDPSMVTVNYEAVDNNRFKKDSSIKKSSSLNKLLDGDFLLTVGHIEPRKNYDKLIDAFSLLQRKNVNRKIKLVIVGQKSHGYKRIIKKIEANSNILYLNFIPEEELIWLYNNAKLFIFPSYYEGFGFPPLEAACFNLVSVVSNQSSIPEVCGESAFYFNPFNVEDIAFKIDHALNNPKEYEIKRKLLKENVERFSWRKNAVETIKIYKNTL